MIHENAYGHAKRLRWILSQTPRTARVVEVGCGTGRMITLPMAEAGYAIVGLDTHEPSVEAGRKLFEAAGLDPATLQVGGLADLDFRPDVVIASEVLEHLPDGELAEMLGAIRHALAPGGRLLVTVPNGFGWFELESHLWYRAGLGSVIGRFEIDERIKRLKGPLFGWGLEDFFPATLSTSPHVQRFSHRSIRAQLGRAGFEVTGITGSVLFAGPLSNLLFAGVRPIMSLNCALGTWLPRIAAGFYVACRVGSPAPGQPPVARSTAATAPECNSSGTRLRRWLGRGGQAAKGYPVSRTQRGREAGGDRLTVLMGARGRPEWADGRVVEMGEVIRWGRQGVLGRHLLRYREARLLTYRLDVLPSRLLAALVVRALSRGACTLEDERGARLPVGPVTLARLAARFALDFARRPGLLRRVAGEVERLTDGEAARAGEPALTPDGPPLYLRTDLWFGVQSGGSVGHIAGVLNHLDRFARPPVFLTTDVIPTVRADIEAHVIAPGAEFWDLGEVPGLAFTDRFVTEAVRRLGGRRPAFVYQRHSLGNYPGVKLARHYGVPFVLEYNGSEVWVSRNWGRPLKYERLSSAIEALNLAAAALIVVVSRQLADELASRSVPPPKILVNPNGVDPQRYSPDVDGAAVRRRHGLDAKTVIGFIGTFGAWHGAEVLAEAFGRLLASSPSYRDRLRLFLIGDGVRMPEVRAALAHHGVGEAAVLTGLVPQAEGPAHLAACDVLVSPHVPNPDGSPFFGSPTKLFEYMAMGRGIVASRLGQIGEVVAHDETAWLVEPGDADDLARGLDLLIRDPSRRARLGAAARREAVAKHTWLEHTRRIVEALRERCR